MIVFERPLRASKHCRHYSYNSGPCCARGLDLNVPTAVRPCMPDPTSPCTLREEYTAEEREAWENAATERMGRLGAAVSALPKAIPLRTSGSIVCPNCGGKLSYARWHRGAEILCDTDYCCGARFNIAAGKEWPSRAK